MFERIPRRLTAATVALAGFGAGVGIAAGAHQHRVTTAVSQARETAQLVEASRASLESSYSRAVEASSYASDVTAHETVAEAATDLKTVAAEAQRTATRLNVAIETPDVESALDGADSAADATDAEDSEATDPAASAEPTTEATPEASPSADAEVDADADAEADAEAAESTDPAEVVDDAQVRDVLEGRVTDIETVEETISQLEQAAAALELQARRVDGSAAQLEAAAAVATLERANNDLEEQVEAISDVVAAAEDSNLAVKGMVTDNATRETAAEARKALATLAATEVDREDAEAVAEFRSALVDQAEVLAQAQAAVTESHESWVTAENKRRDAENEKRQAAYKEAVARAKQERLALYAKAAANNQSGWSGQPSGTSYANGQIPSSQLCALDFAPSYQLQCSAAEALELADAAYYADTGSHLEVISAYRSYSAQVSTAATRGSYAAVPGTSNHGWGMAVDLGTSSASWLRANGEDYGWVHPLWARSSGSKPEAWHLEFVAPQASSSIEMPSNPDLLEHVSSVLD